ncbi:MAG TPA: Spy/CpxP family protein refolding chaperone [Blastocatellia bacterium]|nr:Spy/CpxP family protein refolding chaperone [Blastocatellia bacterium]
MRTWLAILILIIAHTALAIAQDKHSAYSGEEKREIKALSPEEIKAYLEAQGMGLARAAELNHYPGPKHVLDLASELQLTETQAQEARSSFERMRREAARLGALIVERERELDRLFASRQIDASKLESLTREIARLQGELRLTHLKAHLEMRAALSDEQVKKYDHLRGYAGGGHSQHDQHNKKH